MSCCTACDEGKTCDNLVANAKKWIQKAIKHPGSFAAYAKGHGGLNSDGSINPTWAKSLLSKPDVSETIKKRARLFFTLKKMH